MAPFLFPGFLKGQGIPEDDGQKMPDDILSLSFENRLVAPDFG